MRREDKALRDRDELEAVLAEAQVLHLAMAGPGGPYLVPLSFGWDGRRLYFHTARAGHKLDLLALDPRVCFNALHEVRLLRHPESACSWTFAYHSVSGTGRVVELTDPAERRAALDEIMRHYGGPGAWDYAAATLAGTRVWAIEVETMTGKRSPGPGKPEPGGRNP